MDQAQAPNPDDRPEPDEPEGVVIPPKLPSRNPWLPGVVDPPRRSAGLEDIFRTRPGAPAPAGGAWRARLLRFDAAINWGQVVAGLVLVMLAGTSVHILGAGEQGLVTTLGRYDRTIGPGLNLTLPWPAQAVAVHAVSTSRSLVMPAGDAENLVLTRAGDPVNLGWQMRWSISDLPRFSARVAAPEPLIAAAGVAAIRASLAEVDLDTALAEAHRPELEATARSRAQAMLDRWQAGVRVDGIDIRRAEPPARLAETWGRIASAMADSQKLKDQTELYSAQVISRADADAAEFNRAYQQYRAAPEVTRRRLYYQTIEAVLARNPKVIGAGATMVAPPAQAGPATSPAARVAPVPAP